MRYLGLVLAVCIFFVFNDDLNGRIDNTLTFLAIWYTINTLIILFFADKLVKYLPQFTFKDGFTTITYIWIISIRMLGMLGINFIQIGLLDMNWLFVGLGLIMIINFYRVPIMSNPVNMVGLVRF